MTTQQVADRFYELSQMDGYQHIHSELYSNEVKSIEPEGSMFQNAVGLDGLAEKGQQFGAMIETMHGGYCSKPLVAGHFFTCVMGMDVTLKGQPRMQMDEVAVYEVRDGKIVSEQFFY
ncbi:MAG: nuclear transport factor 2 family protein [Bacteroidetes bacterium]|nr:nuclear transport factor 2 family protein [Bacteroidota bacterium]